MSTTDDGKDWAEVADISWKQPWYNAARIDVSVWIDGIMMSGLHISYLTFQSTDNLKDMNFHARLMRGSKRVGATNSSLVDR